MVEMIRHCPDCGWDRPFEQHHSGAAGCPDSPDGYCPRWSCTSCGTDLLIGFIPFMYSSSSSCSSAAAEARPHVRVA
jgi:hypothetical protein